MSDHVVDNVPVFSPLGLHCDFYVECEEGFKG